MPRLGVWQKGVVLLYSILFLTSCFCHPPGDGARLEKGALSPLDPPDFVPCFARPNSEPAALAPFCSAQHALTGKDVNSSTRYCLPLIVLRGATHHYVFRRAKPLDTNNSCFGPDQPPGAFCTNLLKLAPGELKGQSAQTSYQEAFPG